MLYNPESKYISYEDIGAKSFFNRVKETDIFKYFISVCEIYSNQEILLAIDEIKIVCGYDNNSQSISTDNFARTKSNYLVLKASYSDHIIVYNAITKEFFLQDDQNKRIAIIIDLKLKNRKLTKCISNILNSSPESFDIIHEESKKLFKINRNLLFMSHQWGGKLRINGKMAGWHYENIKKWIRKNPGYWDVEDDFEGIVAHSQSNKIVIKYNNKPIEFKSYQQMKAFI